MLKKKRSLTPWSPEFRHGMVLEADSSFASIVFKQVSLGAIPMHSTGVAFVCLLVTAASVFGISLPSEVCLAVLVLSVAIIGVPHGGLDHWTGRRLLEDLLPKIWAAVFFPAYLGVALLVILGWNLFPVVTAVGFFAISAWHFGLEDEQYESPSNLLRSLFAIAVGGVVIWIPSLTRPMQFEALLSSILPSDLAASGLMIVTITKWIAITMLPIAAMVIAQDIIYASHRGRAIRNTCFAMLFASADILLSFGIYFCGWHSIRGLRRLAHEHGKSTTQVFLSAMPLSIGAISLAAVGMWLWSSGQMLSVAMTRTLFVALSAIAVPHLLLHGPITEFAASRLKSQRVTLPRVGVTS